jgi:hypothetical protein
VSTDAAKKAAAIMADIFYAENSAMATDFYKSSLFDSGAARGPLEVSERKMLATTEESDGEKRPNIFPEEALDNLGKAYLALTKAERSNGDAQFDLAMVYVLLGYRSETKDWLEKSAPCLALALRAGSQSGRDFRSIVLDSPTFLPYEKCRNSDAEHYYDALMQRFGTTGVDQLERFQRAYYRYGY